MSTSFNNPIPGATTVIAKLEVRNNPDLPVADMQHIEGGAFSVATLADRDAIPVLLRQRNVTRCYVESEEATYVLRNGIDNLSWLPELAKGVNGLDGAQLTKLVDDQQLTVGQIFSLALPVDIYGTTPVFQVAGASNLPAGTSLDRVARTISGTPTTAGTFVSVVDYVNPVTQKLAQYVLVFVVAPIGGSTAATSTLTLRDFLPVRPVLGQQGTAFSFDVPTALFRSSTGRTVGYFAADGLPAGLSLVSNRITGTPTETGRFTVIMEATDGNGGNAQYSLILIVNAPGSVAATTVGAANFDLVFDPIADDPTSNQVKIDYDYDFALQLSEPGTAELGQRAVPGSSDSRFIGAKSIAQAIAIAALGSSAGGTNRQRFDRFAVSLAVLRNLYPTKTTISFGLYAKRKAANPTDTANNKLSAVTINRSKTSGIVSKAAVNNVDFTTNGDALAPITATNNGAGWLIGTAESLLLTVSVNLSTGEAALGVPPTTAPSNQPPTVTNPAPDAVGRVGTTYSQTLPANEFSDSDGTVVSTSASGLPPGLSYDAPNHTVSGTPTTAGTYNVVITATDNQGATITDPFVLTINPAPTAPANQPPTVTNPAPDGTGTVGTAYSQTLPANEFTDSDGTIQSIAVQGLPPGLSFNLDSKTILGTPTTAGTYSVSITATDNNQASVTDPIVITISAQPTQTTYTRDGADYVA